jgi:hypothetical protein
MDVDPQPVNGAASPPPPPKAASNPSAQKNFPVPIPNGSVPNGNGNGNDEAPAPPPHKSNPSSPVPSPIEDAESYKTAGNRFFKEKNYAKAIEQYSKGMTQLDPRTSMTILFMVFPILLQFFFFIASNLVAPLSHHRCSVFSSFLSFFFFPCLILLRRGKTTIK